MEEDMPTTASIAETTEGIVRRILYNHVESVTITFEDLAEWYIEQREELLTEESRACALQDKVVKFIRKMIDDGHLIELQEDLQKEHLRCHRTGIIFPNRLQPGIAPAQLGEGILDTSVFDEVNYDFDDPRCQVDYKCDVMICPLRLSLQRWMTSIT